MIAFIPKKKMKLSLGFHWCNHYPTFLRTDLCSAERKASDNTGGYFVYLTVVAITICYYSLLNKCPLSPLTIYVFCGVRRLDTKMVEVREVSALTRETTPRCPHCRCSCFRWGSFCDACYFRRNLSGTRSRCGSVFFPLVLCPRKTDHSPMYQLE